MSKFSKVLVACAAMAAVATPAAAIEADFTGFLQARGFAYDNLDGSDRNDDSVRGADQRFRLWANTALHENVKAVFGIEVDTLYGGADNAAAQGSGGGDLNADSKDIEIKNVYLDFNIPNWNTNVKVGVQPWQLGRGFIAGDDGSGVQVRYTPVQGQSLALYWIKGVENEIERDGDDLDYYQIQYDMKVSDWNVAPFIGYMDGQAYGTAIRDLEGYYLGVNADGKAGPLTLGATAILNSWDADGQDGTGVALWGKATYAVASPTILSLEAAYYGDDENGAFVSTNGYNNFSEIVTGGRFDARTDLGGDQTVTGAGNAAFRRNAGANNDSYNMNFMYLKLGAEHKYSEVAKVSAYYIYSEEAQDVDVAGREDRVAFGHEIDLYYDHEIVKGLTGTLAGAYLFADNDFGDGDDAWKLGTALTYKF